MKWSEITKRLKKIKYSVGDRKTHFTVWNCPCSGTERHPVGVGNHLTEECRCKGLIKRQLGPHFKDFGSL